MKTPREKEIKILKDNFNSPIKKGSNNNSAKKLNTIGHTHITEAFPKNANEYRHILEDIKCCHADIDFMCELRKYKKINSLEKLAANEPTFYKEDLNKYKTRSVLKKEEKEILQVNLGRYKYILSDRSKYAINSPTFKYEVRLRTEPTYLSQILKINKNKETKDNKEKKNLKLNIKKWDPTVNPSINLFNTLLPPILPQSKEVFAKNEKRIGRPIIIKRNVNSIDGAKINVRYFDYNYTLALRYPSDHLPNSKYSNDYGVSNLGEIRHLLKNDNMTMTTSWSTYLRGIKKKQISPEEIKKTEQKLRDKSNKKNVK